MDLYIFGIAYHHMLYLSMPQALKGQLVTSYSMQLLMEILMPYFISFSEL